MQKKRAAGKQEAAKKEIVARCRQAASEETKNSCEKSCKKKQKLV